ncbi:hypothetical protein [Streptomyces sp. NBC_01304]|uniref:hypothetical protein n=1 Tax=Streptomyces sp. NBC_01304 TaxID=2903818 RepID=UPI002E134C8B|nr:hypothetical protein OG430_04570 [Streptomyces sp. NBC_01304]
MSEQLNLIAVAHGEDPEELQLRVEALRDDLLQLDVDRVERPVAGPAPQGTRAGAMEAINALLVVLTPTLPLLQGLIAVVQNWSGWAGGRTVVLRIGDNELAVTGVRGREQQRLIDTWIAATVGQSSMPPDRPSIPPDRS